MIKTIRAIRAIAINSFREAIRSKVLATLLFFAVLLSLGTVALGQMSVHEERRVTIDLGIFLSTIFSIIIAVYTMVTSLHTELERRTIYTLLSKPIARWHFLVGKYLGVMGVQLAVVAGMGCLTAVLLALQEFELTSQLGWAFVTIYLQNAIVTAVALAFASFSTPLLTGMMTLSVFILGNLLSLLDELMPHIRPALGENADVLVAIIWVLVPNFEQLNLVEAVTHSVPVTGPYIASAFWYAAAEVAVLLAVASGIFSRRDFA